MFSCGRAHGWVFAAVVAYGPPRAMFFAGQWFSSSSHSLSPAKLAMAITDAQLLPVIRSVRHVDTADAAAKLLLQLHQRAGVLGRSAPGKALIEELSAAIRTHPSGLTMALAMAACNEHSTSAGVPAVIEALHTVNANPDALTDGTAYRLCLELLKELLQLHPSLK